MKHKRIPSMAQGDRLCRPFRVLVALRLSHLAGQGKLAGVFASGKTSAWDLTLLRDSEELNARVLARIRSGGFDGIIATVKPRARFFRALAAAPCPVVVMDADACEFSSRKRNLVIIRNDPESIARAALEAFDRVGNFADYAYVPDAEGSEWSLKRERAFAKRLAERGIRIKVAESDRSRFLASLTPPAAVLAANDATARDILADAVSAGKAIPDEMSLLGIDNDPVLCENARIPLSSIEPDFAEEGRAAAVTLDRMMRSSRATSKRLLPIAVRRIVIRESTRALPPAQKLIERALRYIAASAASGLTPAQVVAHLGVSRALLDLRLKQFGHPTLLTLITDARLEAVKTALRHSDRSILQIAAACGFHNHKSLGNLFRRRIGMSMSGYRKCAARA